MPAFHHKREKTFWIFDLAFYFSNFVAFFFEGFGDFVTIAGEAVVYE